MPKRVLYRTHLAESPWGSRSQLLLAIGAALIVAVLGSCRPPPPSIPQTEEALVNPDSLLAAAIGEIRSGDFKGRGSVRLQMEGRNIPALNLHFALRDTGEVWAMLRPGMLSPVMSLWAGLGGWSIHIPRERAVLTSCGLDESTVRPSDHHSRESASPLEQGLLIARLGRLILQPQALLLLLEHPTLLSRGEHWIFSGRPQDFGPTVPAAEVWVEKESLGITSWGLRTSGGQSLLRVAYGSAVTKERRRPTQVHFVLEALEISGTLRLQRLSQTQIDSIPRPAIPAGWNILSEKEIRRMLETGLEYEPQVPPGGRGGQGGIPRGGLPPRWGSL